MSRRVYGVGSSEAEIAFVGEGPGWEEDKAGVPFVGKTGQELDRHLDGSRLPTRADVWLANIYREYHGKDYVYTADDLALDLPVLVSELQALHNLTLIVTLGRHATREFLGDVDMDDVQGIPWLLPASERWSFLSDTTTIFPIVHPAAGFHNPEMSPYVVSGFHELGNYLAGLTHERHLFDDAYPEPHYEEITTEARLREVIRGLQTSSSSLHIDTEGSPARPWSLQFSSEPGSAYLLRAARRDLLAIFRDYLVRSRPRLTYHSALHDLRMMGVLGLPTDLPFDDTMIMAYLLQIEPQGLKALGVRHCGMKMQSYQDVLGDASLRLALDYVQGLWDIEQLDYEYRCEMAFWSEIEKGRKLKVHPKLPKTPLHKAAMRALSSKDPRKLWSNQVEDIQVAGYNRLGPMSEATLDFVPREDAIRYACRDADCTGRVKAELEPRIDA